MANEVYIQKVSGDRFHLYAPLKYTGNRPTGFLWQAYIFGEGTDVGGLPEDVFTYIADYCTYLIPTTASDDNWLVFAYSDWTTNGSWSMSGTTGTDDFWTRGSPWKVLGHYVRYTTNLGAYATISFTIPNHWESATLTMQWYFASNQADQTVTLEREGTPVTLNGRGLWWTNTASNDTECAALRGLKLWDADGVWTGHPPGSIDHCPVELARNLRPGTYTLKVEKTAGDDRASFGRVMVMRQYRDGEITLSPDAMREYFPEMQNWPSKPGPFGTLATSSLSIANSYGGTWYGGMHGNETQSSAVWQYKNDLYDEWATLDVASMADESWGGPYYAVRLTTVGALDDGDTKVADIGATFTLDSDSLKLHTSRSYTWAVDGTISKAYAAMYRGSATTSSPTTDGGTTLPYSPTWCLVRDGDDTGIYDFRKRGAAIVNGSLDGAKRWFLYTDLQERDQRNVGRDYVIECATDQAAYSDGTAKMLFAENPGDDEDSVYKSYWTGADNYDLTVGEAWTVEYYRYYQERTNILTAATWDELEAAVEQAKDGDTIQLTAASYTQDSELIVNKSLTITSTASGGSRIEGDANAITLTSGTSASKNISWSNTIFDANDEDRPALSVTTNGANTTVTLTDCQFLDAGTYDGLQVRTKNSSTDVVTVTCNGCLATGNTNDGFNIKLGTGASGSGTLTLNDCTSTGNTADGASPHSSCSLYVNGGSYTANDSEAFVNTDSGSYMEIRNAYIEGAAALSGAHVVNSAASATAKLYNCTIVGNCEANYGLVAAVGGTVTLYNCKLEANGNNTEMLYPQGDGTITAWDCLLDSGANTYDARNLVTVVGLPGTVGVANLYRCVIDSSRTTFGSSRRQCNVSNGATLNAEGCVFILGDISGDTATHTLYCIQYENGSIGTVKHCTMYAQYVDQRYNGIYLKDADIVITGNLIVNMYWPIRADGSLYGAAGSGYNVLLDYRGSVVYDDDPMASDVTAGSVTFVSTSAPFDFRLSARGAAASVDPGTSYQIGHGRGPLDSDWATGWVGSEYARLIGPLDAGAQQRPVTALPDTTRTTLYDVSRSGAFTRAGTSYAPNESGQMVAFTSGVRRTKELAVCSSDPEVELVQNEGTFNTEVQPWCYTQGKFYGHASYFIHSSPTGVAPWAEMYRVGTSPFVTPSKMFAIPSGRIFATEAPVIDDSITYVSSTANTVTVGGVYGNGYADVLNDHWIAITAGTGAGQEFKITDSVYSAPNMVFTIDGNWGPEPDGTSTIEIYSGKGGTQRILYSDDEGVTWTGCTIRDEWGTVDEDNPNALLTPGAYVESWGFARSSLTGTILIVEYRGAATGRRIYRSTDNGATFQEIYDSNSGGQTHFHAVVHHAASDRWLAAIGDGSSFQRVIYVEGDADFNTSSFESSSSAFAVGWTDLIAAGEANMQPTTFLDFGHPTKVLCGSDTDHMVYLLDVYTGGITRKLFNWDPRAAKHYNFSGLFYHNGIYYASSADNSGSNQQPVVSVSNDLKHWAIFAQSTATRFGPTLFGVENSLAHGVAITTAGARQHWQMNEPKVSNVTGAIIAPAATNLFSAAQATCSATTGWVSGNGGTFSSSSHAQSGNSVKWTRSPTGVGVLYSPAVTPVAATRYVGGAWIYANISTSLNLRLRYNGAAVTSAHYFGLYPGWQYVYTEGYTPAGTDDLQLYFYTSAPASIEPEIYIDSISITPAPAVPWITGGASVADVLSHSVDFGEEWTHVYTFQPFNSITHLTDCPNAMYLTSYVGPSSALEVYYDPSDDKIKMTYDTVGTEPASTAQIWEKEANIRIAVRRTGEKAYLTVADARTVEHVSATISVSDLIGAGSWTTGDQNGANVMPLFLADAAWFNSSLTDAELETVLGYAAYGDYFGDESQSGEQGRHFDAVSDSGAGEIGYHETEAEHFGEGGIHLK